MEIFGLNRTFRVHAFAVSRRNRSDCPLKNRGTESKHFISLASMRVTSVAVTAIALFASVSTAQVTDCNNDGIPDSAQFGENYAFWLPESTDGSGNLSDPSAWCPAPFTGGDRLIFQHQWSAGMGTIFFTSDWAADSCWCIGGRYKISGPVGARFDLYGNQDPAEAMRIAATITWDCEGFIGGPAFIGKTGTLGSLTIVGKSLFCYFDLNIGTDAIGAVRVDGGTMKGQVIRVGATDQSTATRGELTVGPLGTIEAFDRIEISDIATINGDASTSLITGAAFTPQYAPQLQGSGRVGTLNASRLAVVPTLALGADGSVDAILDVSGSLTFVDQATGMSGVLQIRPAVGATSQVVPSVRAGSALLGGLLRVMFDPTTAAVFPANTIVESESVIEGAFAAMQAVGLPPSLALRTTTSTDGRSRQLSVVPVPLPPSFASGQRAALLRVARDGVLADFDGDGDLDAAIALAPDAQGVSRIRFFKTGSDGSQTDAQFVDIFGDAHSMAVVKFASDSLPSVAVAMGSADRVTIVRNVGQWTFSPFSVALLSGDTPTGIAAGAFVAAPIGSMSEIAVGCPGSKRVYIIGEAAVGGFVVRQTLENLGGDIVRAGNLDGIGTSDFVVADRAALVVSAVTAIGDSVGAPLVQRLPLPALPSAMCLASFGDDTTSRESLVVALEGAVADGDDAIENLAIFRPGTSGLRPPARLSAANDLRSVTAGDFDGDGMVDLAVCNTVGETEQLQFLVNRSDPKQPAAPLVFNDGGVLAGVMRPRIVVGGNVNRVGADEVLTIAAGNPSGSSLGPEFDEGIGSMGSGGGGCASGDANCDGIVNGLDLAAVLSGWGTCTSTCAADFNADGMVDGVDLTTLLSNWTP